MNSLTGSMQMPTFGDALLTWSTQGYCTLENAQSTAVRDGDRHGLCCFQEKLDAEVAYKNVLQILLKELQTVAVSPDMMADAMASVVITGPTKTTGKDEQASPRSAPCPDNPLNQSLFRSAACLHPCLPNASRLFLGHWKGLPEMQQVGWHACLRSQHHVAGAGSGG